MGFELISFTSGLIQRQAADEIVQCNDRTAQFGLSLTQGQAAALAQTRFQALQSTGRVEFGGGVINQIILTFCDSPYLSPENYADTLHELTEMFYAFKNETMDLVADEELIRFMNTAFNGVCQGSLELLAGRELERLARALHDGLPVEAALAGEPDETRPEDGEAYDA